MDRPASRCRCCAGSCPHARGDEPRIHVSHIRISPLSPRAWGWTGHLGRHRPDGDVVPTRVGMDRDWNARIPIRHRCPHARGDGPEDRTRSYLVGVLSPRAWGWTGMHRGRPTSRPVVPTRVGMDRGSPAAASRRSGCPHARGDGPAVELAQIPVELLSPRAWGWTGQGDRDHQRHAVVPTRVGMDRADVRPRRMRCRCPHARGDGPFLPLGFHERGVLSPRAWGWTEMSAVLWMCASVVPTRVGMDRSLSWTARRRGSCPHARGDGPSYFSVASRSTSLSPRAWGWTVVEQHAHEDVHVVPTRVGMDRGCGTGRPARGRCPHARGDGPATSVRSASGTSLSPRAWGWTVPGPPRLSHLDVVPTRVEMDRIPVGHRNRTRRCPHARGDGPKLPRRNPIQHSLSPRAWGWTGLTFVPDQNYGVVPTRVGMDRSDVRAGPELRCCPHARGDGPILNTETTIS